MAGTHRIQILTPKPICLLCTSSPPPFSAKLPNNNVPNFFGSRIYSHQISTPLLSRRLVIASVSGLFDALTGGGSAREAVAAVRRGMLLFRQVQWQKLWRRSNLPPSALFLVVDVDVNLSIMVKGDVQGSLLEFDKAIDLDPRQKAYLWQRGLSLYYLDRFEEGAEQFRLDVAQNPNDTEESIWCFLCEAQLYGVDEARRRFLEVGVDPRPVMRESYRMFKDGGDPEKLVAAFSSGGQSEYFYASLYAGLYYESERKSDEAKHHLIASCKSPYGSRSEDYMASLAKVHCACRNWTFT